MTTKYPSTGAHPTLTELPDPPRPPDAMKQRRHVASADQVLRSYFRRQPDTLVSGEGYLCYQARDARTSPHPDCLVAIGLTIPPEMIENVANGYVISEIGRPPDFVLEVASPSTGVRDYTTKRDDYARLGVKEYWRFDPSGGAWHDAPLAGDSLVAGTYQPIPVFGSVDQAVRGYSTALGLELHWEEGCLRFREPDSREFLPDLIEALDALALAEARAAGAEARATGAESRATGAESRATGAESRAAGAESRAAGAESRAAGARAAAAEQRVRELQEKLRRQSGS